MDDERRRGKEYYQVNLDTGRIFWLAFLLGIVVIGIFIFGFYIGGEKLKKGLGTLGKGELIEKENASVETVRKEEKELPLLDIFNKDLEEETRFLDVESEEEVPPQITKETEIKQEPYEPFDVEEFYKNYEQEKVQTPAPSKPQQRSYTYREAGNYYIQVASFIKKENAEALAKSLRKKLYKVIIEEATVEDKLFYRVQVGPFETKGIAKNTMIAMKNRYDLKDPFVLKKKNT